MNDLSPDQALLKVRNKALLTIGVMGAQIMQVLDTTIANVALPHMQASLGASINTVSWVLTSYIVATAIALPLTGWLSDRIGSRILFLIAVAGFVFASMLCGIATSLDEMVIFRAFQGIFAAFINPLSQTTMLDINRPKDQAKAMSVWGMGVMIAPIMGPVIGGWLTESYNWRWVFYVNVPVGALTLAILWFLLPSRPIRRRGFDIGGFILLGTALASFQLLADRGQQVDWFQSWEIVIYACVLASAAWMFGVHLATAEKPLFERAIFENRNLVVGMVFMVIVGISTMAPLALLPPMLQQIFGYSVIQTGLMMAPRGLGVLLTTFIGGRIIGKVDVRIIIFAGFLVFALSVRMMASFSPEMGSQPVIIAGFVQGLGMGMVFIPLNSLAFATLAPAIRTEGSSLLNLARSIGQSGGVSLVTALLARNIQISHADLVQAFRPDSLIPPQITDPGAYGVAYDTALAAADALINRQAAMIAYLDDFYLMGWVAVAVTPLVFLLSKPRGRIEAIVAE